MRLWPLISSSSKSNIVVFFDENIIKDDGSLPIVVAEQKESGGETVNVIQITTYPLGCYIQFFLMVVPRFVFSSR